jgi:hypothetical protein
LIENSGANRYFNQQAKINNQQRLAVRSLPIQRFFLSLRPRELFMDKVQGFILDLGWIFFIAWGAVLAAVSLIAFWQDLFPSTSRPRYEPLPVQGD